MSKQINRTVIILLAYLCHMSLKISAQSPSDLERWKVSASVYNNWMKGDSSGAYNQALRIAVDIVQELEAFNRPLPDKLLADWQLRQSRALLFSDKFIQAKESLGKVMTNYYAQTTVREDQHIKGIVYQNLSLANNTTDSLVDAANYGNKAIEILSTLSADSSRIPLVFTYIVMVDVLRKLGRHDEAYQKFQKGISAAQLMPDSAFDSQAALFQNIALSYYMQNNMSAARDNFYMASKLYIKSNKEKENWLNIYNNLYSTSSLYYQCGDYENAIRKGKEAVSFVVGLDLGIDDKHPILIPAYSNMIQAHIVEDDFLSANKLFERVAPHLEYITNNYGLDVRFQHFQVKGKILAGNRFSDNIVGNKDEARKAFTQGLNEAKEKGREYVDRFIYDIALTYYDEKKFQEAIRQMEHLQDSIISSNTSYRGNAEIFRLRADCKIQMGDFVSAENDLVRAAKCLSDTLNINSRVLESRLWHGIFVAYTELYYLKYKKYKDLSDLETSLKYLSQARFWMVRSHAELCAYNATDLLNIQHLGKLIQLVLNEKNKAQKATVNRQMFEWLDQCKAREMYEYFASLHNFKSEKAPELAESIKNLHYDITYQNNEAKNGIYNMQQKYDSLMRVIAPLDPNFSFGKRMMPNSSIKEVQKSLSDDESIIEYVLNDSLLTIFVLDKGQIHKTKTVHVNNSFYANLNSLIKIMDRDVPLDIRYGNSPKDLLILKENFANASFYLDSVLIQPIAKYLKKRVIIIPDGLLHHLPFQILLSKQPTKSDNFTSLNYRVKDFAISYCHSAALLCEIRKRPVKSPQLTKPLLGVFPFNGEIVGYNPISVTDFINWIKTQIKPVDILTNSFANIDSLKKIIKNYNNIILITHGVIDTTHSSKRPFLLLRTISGGMDSIFVEDFYSMRLNANFVMTTTCESANGLNRRGEGIRSISTAIISTGAKSVCSSTNNLDHDSGLFITQQILKHMETGNAPRDIVLQKAQLDYLESVKSDKFKSQPAYWGTLILSGSSQ
jgi:tetratricopeptide (TPR) repeat protein